MPGSISHAEQLNVRPVVPTATALSIAAQRMPRAMHPRPAPSILEMCNNIIPGQMHYTKDQCRLYLSQMRYTQPLPKDASLHNLVTRVREESVL